MEDLKIVGRVKSIGEVVKPDSDNDFKYCHFVMNREVGSYSQDIPFQFLNDKTALRTELTVGKEFEITFDIKARRAKDSDGQEKDGWFTNLVAYKIKKV